MKNKIFISTLVLLLSLSCSLNIYLFTLLIKGYQQRKTFQIDPSSYLQYHELNKSIRKKSENNKRIILYGDSRAFQWDPLPKLSGCEFINRGLSGETTSQSILRIEHDLISLEPDIAIIEIGVNDCNSIGALPHFENFIISSCKDNIYKIITILNKNKIKAVLLTIFPVGSVSPSRLPIWSDKTRDSIKDINQYILKLNSPNTTIVNCDNIFLDGNKIKRKYAKDMLHLNHDGYMLLNNYIKPYLVKVLEKIKTRD